MTHQPKISKEQFTREYAARAGLTVEELLKRRVVLPCACEYEGCEGWAAVPIDVADLPQGEWGEWS